MQNTDRLRRHRLPQAFFRLALGMGLAVGLALSAPAQAATDSGLYPHATEPYVEISPEDQVARMGAGMNIIGGYEGYWTDKPTKFTDADIRRVAEAGFKTIRVPIFTFAHTIDMDGHLDPVWLKKLDHIVDLALANHLIVILDEHDFDDCANDVDACAVKLPQIWYDLSERYRNTPSSVVFELMNEPHGKIDAQIWNAWLPDLIKIVRLTNPTRNIIVGPVGWNSPDQIDSLVLPEEDHHLIVTFHYYSPMEFTHQGASWVEFATKLRDIHWKGTDTEKQAIVTTFEKMQAWGKAHHRPIFLGEYGTYGQYNPRMDERAAWTHFVSLTADRLGFARAYWYYEDGEGFGVWDAQHLSWRKPILDALKP